MNSDISFTHPSSALLIKRMADYLELTKPRLTSLVLLTAAIGFWMSMDYLTPLKGIVPLLLGMAMTVGGANALNQWMERQEDALMHRTQNRPLPSGRLRQEEALGFGLLLSIGGIGGLTLFVNSLSAILACISLISYVWVYTPMKRLSPLCTLIGALPGACPPVIGSLAARGSFGPESGVLFAILFVWQLPHFLAIATLYRDDYARAGFRMLPVIEPSGQMTSRQIILYALALIPITLFPTFLGLTKMIYFFGALILSVIFVSLSFHAARERSPLSMRRLFLASILYLPMLLTVLSFDKAI